MKDQATGNSYQGTGQSAEPAGSADCAGHEVTAAEQLASKLAKELRRRWSSGEQIPAEDLLRQHPELWQYPVAAVDLIYEEFNLRQAAAQDCIEQDIIRRFPQWAGRLRMMLDCHRLIFQSASASQQVDLSSSFRAVPRSTVGILDVAAEQLKVGKDDCSCIDAANDTVPRRHVRFRRRLLGGLGTISERRGLLILFVLLGFAFLIDVRIAGWAHNQHPMTSLPTIRRLFWWSGHFATTLAIAMTLLLWHARKWRAAVMLLSSAAMAGLLCSVIKWVSGRTRPYRGPAAFDWHPFVGGLKGLFSGPENLTFPSGHACLLFSMAACLSRLVPRWSLLFFSLATVAASFRVLVGAHYPSDVVAGGIVGVVSVHLVVLIAEAWVGAKKGPAVVVANVSRPAYFEM